MTLPILLVVLLALFEFTLLFFARSEVVDACRNGARAATLPGATYDSIEQQIRKSLNPRMQRGLWLELHGGERSGDVVTVILHVPMSAAAPDLLWPCGFSLQGRELVAQTNMVKE